MKAGRITIVIDGQWGSTGKGKIAGYLALRDTPDIAVCNFMTNAGHWFRSKAIGNFLVQQLPIAAINQNIDRLLIAASAGITLDTLFKEIEQFESVDVSIRDRLGIDRHAVIITEEHKRTERDTLVRISSTTKGCGAALAQKIMRHPSVLLAKDVPELAPFVCNVSDELHAALQREAKILGETAQGFDLSLNHGHVYPYVTSRDVTPMSFMNDIGVPSKYLGDVYGVIRSYPIRVGNVMSDDGQMLGYSGDFYNDQVEVSWDDIRKWTGREIADERTTVTNKIRRIFSFSREQYQKFVRICAPTKIAINFMDYLISHNDPNKVDWRDYANTNPFIQEIKTAGVPIALLGYGADNDEIVDLEQQT